MSNDVLSSIVDAMDTHKGKRLTFTVADVAYGIDIQYVRQIIGIQKITKIPQQPSYVKGVINLRGQIVPIVDMRLRFNKPEIPYDDRTCTIILNLDDLVIGIIVDRVTEVINISDDNIAAVPEFNNDIRNDFVSGIAKINEKVIIILNAHQVVKHDKETYNNVMSKK